MRYLGYSVEEFEKIDIPDYMVLMEAVQYREADKSFWTHFLAWQTMRAAGKKKAGKGYKMAFPRFKKFYDADKAERAIRESRKHEKRHESRFAGLAEHLRRRREKGDG